MKLKLILTTAILGTALGLPSASNAALPSLAGATAVGPASVLEENCYKDAQGVQVYGVRVGVTGFPPNTQFTGTLSYEYIDPPVNPDGSYSTGGSVGPATFTTDANGEFIGFLGTVGVKTIFTWTVDSPYLGGTATKTLTVTCEPKPTTKEQCKNDGWKQFGFKSQGRCVAFVILTRVCNVLERHGHHLKFCPPTPPVARRS